MLTLIVIVLLVFVGLPALVSLILGLVYLLGMFHLARRFVDDFE